MIFRRRHFTRRRAAFTLLELTVAAMMFAIIMAALGGVFFSTMKLRKRTDDALKDTHQLQQALAIIKSDLRSATLPGGVLSTNMSTSFELTASGGSQFEFHTATGLLNSFEPWIDIQRVTYFLRQPAAATRTNGMDLIRGTTRNLLATVQEDFNEQILYHDVDQMAFEFWDGTAWISDWDSTTQTESELAAAPEAIRLSLELTQRPNERVSRILTVTVPIFTGGITNAVAVATN
jgi:type II secretory pathway pseudopilin PulG